MNILQPYDGDLKGVLVYIYIIFYHMENMKESKEK